MRTYVIRRLLLMIPTLWLVSLAVFLMIRLIPGDVIDAIVAEQALLASDAGSVINREAVEKRLGLDAPIYVQYGDDFPIELGEGYLLKNGISSIWTIQGN